tara:strand:+ start:107 stop:508 length:402 start_codon:yes stop_codon:yes gene_type:complete
MNKTKIALPSNRKFGLTFSIIFVFFAIYFYFKNILYLDILFILISIIFLLTAIFKEDALLPFNKIWMMFGLLLGKIVNPLVMGFIFFIIFTPIAILMKLFGRDEMRINIKKYKSNWKMRNKDFKNETEFDKQF